MTTNPEPVDIDFAKLQEEAQELFYTSMVNDAVKDVVFEDYKSSPLAEPIPAEQVKNDFKTAYRELIEDKQGKLRVREGFRLIIENIKGLPNETQCRQELEAAAEKFAVQNLEFASQNMGFLEQIKDLKESDLKDIDDLLAKKRQEEATNTESNKNLLSDDRTLAEALGISVESLHTFYNIAVNFYKDGKVEEALSILELLSQLDTYCHEIWVAKGMCNQRLDDLFSAIKCYMIANLMNPNNPQPYLYSAECFIKANDKENAEGSLRMAEYFKTAENAGWLEPAIANIKKRI